MLIIISLLFAGFLVICNYIMIKATDEKFKDE